MLSVEKRVQESVKRCSPCVEYKDMLLAGRKRTSVIFTYFQFFLSNQCILHPCMKILRQECAQKQKQMSRRDADIQANKYLTESECNWFLETNVAKIRVEIYKGNKNRSNERKTFISPKLEPQFLRLRTPVTKFLFYCLWKMHRILME